MYISTVNPLETYIDDFNNTHSVQNPRLARIQRTEAFPA